MFSYGVLAQLVEQRTLNPFVESSSLSRPTKVVVRFLKVLINYETTQNFLLLTAFIF